MPRAAACRGTCPGSRNPVLSIDRELDAQLIVVIVSAEPSLTTRSAPDGEVEPRRLDDIEAERGIAEAIGVADRTPQFDHEITSPIGGKAVQSRFEVPERLLVADADSVGTGPAELPPAGVRELPARSRSSRPVPRPGNVRVCWATQESIDGLDEVAVVEMVFSRRAGSIIAGRDRHRGSELEEPPVVVVADLWHRS